MPDVSCFVTPCGGKENIAVATRRRQIKRYFPLEVSSIAPVKNRAVGQNGFLLIKYGGEIRKKEGKNGNAFNCI